MKEGKHTRNKFKIIEAYSVLILIATLFMGIGYAVVTETYMDITGDAEAIAQTGVFITNVTSKNAGNSKVNYFMTTTLNSSLSVQDGTVTYDVALYNNSDKNYFFIDVITDKEFSSEYIEYTLSGLEKYVTPIAPNSSLTFSVTLNYIGGASEETLTSILNFRFKEIPILVLSNEGQTYTLNGTYPGYTAEEHEFTVSNTGAVPMSYYFETTLTNPFVAEIYDETGVKVEEPVSIEAGANHKYTFKILWDKAKNNLDYAGKDYQYNVALKATPTDKDYLDYTMTKQFNLNINTSPFNLKVDAEQNITIKNDTATLPITVNNYDTDFNKFTTNYEITIEGNDKFAFSSGEEVITKTISGGSKIDDSFNLQLTADMSSLEKTESLTLKVVSKSPYITEVTIPITISIHSVTVTLNANGGTVSPAAITVYQTRKYVDLPTPTWVGHTFNGWYSAATGGTKYEKTTEVTTDASAQTLYAQWTTHLLADKVKVGDKVNYPINYSNVATAGDGTTHIASDSYTGWRVLSIEGTGDNKYVRLITAGVPMSYYHPATTGSGATTVNYLTNNFFGIGINSTQTNYRYRLCGFKNASGGSITTISALQTVFTNKYTQTSSSGVPIVKSVTKTDVDKVWGKTTANGDSVTTNDLLAIPAKDDTSMYATYYLATANEDKYLWCSYWEGAIIYTAWEKGIRPVVSLKPTVETTGQTNGVWQLSE